MFNGYSFIRDPTSEVPLSLFLKLPSLGIGVVLSISKFQERGEQISGVCPAGRSHTVPPGEEEGRRRELLVFLTSFVPGTWMLILKPNHDSICWELSPSKKKKIRLRRLYHFPKLKNLS